jgi:hypothetical protein
LADKEITSKVPREQIEYAFDLPRQLKNVDKIFARVFNAKQSQPTPKPSTSKKDKPSASKKKKKR